MPNTSSSLTSPVEPRWIAPGRGRLAAAALAVAVAACAAGVDGGGGGGDANIGTLPTTCGDGDLDDGEACDGADLGLATCQDLGFASGTLACTASCGYALAGCVADPGAVVVTDVGPATWSHGAPATLRGVGFGARAHATPMVFDTLESGAFAPGWATANDLDVSTAEPRHARTTYAAHNDFDGVGNHGQFQAPGDVRARWFVQHWVKFDDNWDWGTSGYDGGDRYLANLKLFRLWNPGDVDEDLVVAYLGWEDSLTWEVSNVAADGIGFAYGASSLLSRGAWHVLEYAYAENSALGAADGSFRMTIDGADVFAATGLVTREDVDVLKRPLIIGASAVWGPDSGEDPQAPNDLFLDDVWMDDSWARVALCPGSTWATRGACELQPLTAWADGAIEVTVNQGRFDAGAEAYLYVVRDDGTASLAHGPIQLGVAAAPRP